MENPKVSITCERYAIMSTAERAHAWQVLLAQAGHWPMNGLPLITTDHKTHTVILELLPFAEFHKPIGASRADR